MSKNSAIQKFRDSFKEAFGSAGSISHNHAEDSKDELETLFLNVSITKEWSADKIDEKIRDLVEAHALDKYFSLGDPQTGFGWRELTLYGLN